MTAKNTQSAGSSESLPAVQQGQLQDTVAGIFERLATLEKAANMPPMTNGSFKYSPASKEAIDITVEKDLQKIIGIAGFIKTKEAEYNAGVDALKLTDKATPLFKWLNFTAEAWITDLTIRAGIITEDTERQRLQSLADKLKGFYSRETQLAELLAEAKDVIQK